MTESTALVVRDPSTILKKKTPKGAVYQRPGPGGMMLSYVPWAWVAQQMNKAFGDRWSLGYLAEPKMQGSEVMVLIEVLTPNGRQQAYGSHKYQPNNSNASYSDALQAATSKALRRACARWGIGLDLYLAGGDEATYDDPAAAELAVAVKAALGNDDARFSAAEDTVVTLMKEGKTEFEAWAVVAEELGE